MSIDSFTHATPTPLLDGEFTLLNGHKATISCERGGERKTFPGNARSSDQQPTQLSYGSKCSTFLFDVCLYSVNKEHGF
ncbi:predicted protein [Sclerotinia sclerotiorum 1980 UF-70]|uniref:Uncharacterized protein n=2 Tax=Sclerotinia sclerotiorum (strain ATCC 18683 / 1980 / Ss-1) TaxID=665079 RepID=A7EYH5_SCLS1|nr:predicted protein [Sclerotinia sclerotiorum 1980 UF-70]APA16204.1 hypothetical protein sscle_16g109740 [Sclerotinia sclerotiorum 1980 UF-70]EDN94517.1 predicted protein [Sclerotinia sclerotiorum 1980 UF-70]